MNNNTYYIKNKKVKIFLINLKDSKDRLELVDRQLKAIDLKYERIEAVNGLEYVKNPNILECDKISVNLLSPAYIGCTLSHIRCYEKIIEENIDFALILEDDVFFYKNFKNVFFEVIENNILNEKWDILSFSYSKYLFINSFNTFLNFKNMYVKYNLYKKILFLIKYFYCFLYSLSCLFINIFRIYFVRSIFRFKNQFPASAACYIVNKNIAKILLKENIPLRHISDIIFGVLVKKYKDLRFCIFTPKIAVAREQIEKGYESIINKMNKK